MDNDYLTKLVQRANTAQDALSQEFNRHNMNTIPAVNLYKAHHEIFVFLIKEIASLQVDVDKLKTKVKVLEGP